MDGPIELTPADPVEAVDDLRAAFASAGSVSTDKAPTVPESARLRPAPGAFRYSPADHVLFTHALLFTHGGMVVDPVEEWGVKAEAVGAVNILRCARPLFRGLDLPGTDDPDIWNRLLLAVTVEHWRALENCLAGITLLDPSRRYYARSFRHQVRMPDPFGVDPAPVLVYAVGLTSTEGLAYLESGVLPSARVAAPEAEVLREADAYYGDDARRAA